MATPFDLVINNLVDLGFFQFILPFMITSAIFYGLLRKGKLFGEPDKNVGVNAVISLGAAFLVWASPIIIGIDITADLALFFVQGVSAMLIISIAAMIATMFFGEDLPKQLKDRFHGQTVWWVILKGGKSESGIKAVSSHTGSLAGSYKVYSSIFKQLGLVEARKWVELLGYTKAFLQPMPKGDKIAVITDGGGFGVLAADQAEKIGLNLPEMSQNLKKILAKDATELESLSNPIDLAGDTTVDRYKRVMEDILKSDEYDGVILVVGFQVPKLETTLVDVIDSMKVYGKPIVCFSDGSDFSLRLIKALESKGVPVYDSIEIAVKSMKALVDYSMLVKKK